MKSCISSGRLLSILGAVFWTYKKISSLVLPENGERPVNRIWDSIPKAQISTAVVYSLNYIISGAIYNGVPIKYFG